MAKPFKVGFIGSGGIAMTHMKYLKMIEGVEIVAASDISEGSLNRAKEQYHVGKLYKDYKAMLREEKELDAVSVCTPNGLHAENAIAALEAGRHVIVEKPLAMNAVEGQKMVDAAKKAGKHLVTGFQYRFQPQSQLIRKHLDAGHFGKVNYVRAQALRRRGIPNWGVFGRKDLQGGGPMIDIGVHVLEMAHYMIGSPRPVAASGKTFTFMGNKPCDVMCQWPNWDYKSYSVEDMAVGFIRFDNGTTLVIEASFVNHIEKDSWNVQIMGEKGGATWDPVTIYHDQAGYMMNSTPSFVGKWDAFEHKMRHFVDVCRDGKPSMATGEQGLMVQKIIDGVYASAAAGREVAID